MIFHENCLLTDNSHEISYLIFRKLGKTSQNLLSAAVMIGALNVKRAVTATEDIFNSILTFVLLNK